MFLKNVFWIPWYSRDPVPVFLQCGGSGMFIPDPDADFLPSGIPDLGVKKVPNPGTLIQSRNSVFLYVDFGSTESVAS